MDAVDARELTVLVDRHLTLQDLGGRFSVKHPGGYIERLPSASDDIAAMTPVD